VLTALKTGGELELLRDRGQAMMFLRKTREKGIDINTNRFHTSKKQ
jgi:hypothetical protein